MKHLFQVGSDNIMPYSTQKTQHVNLGSDSIIIIYMYNAGVGTQHNYAIVMSIFLCFGKKNYNYIYIQKTN